jgi:hypothetical protein
LQSGNVRPSGAQQTESGQNILERSQKVRHHRDGAPPPGPGKEFTEGILKTTRCANGRVLELVEETGQDIAPRAGRLKGEECPVEKTHAHTET